MPDRRGGRCLNTLNQWPCVLDAPHTPPHEAYNGVTWVSSPETGPVCGNQYLLVTEDERIPVGCMRPPGHLGEHRDRKEKPEARVVWD